MSSVEAPGAENAPVTAFSPATVPEHARDAAPEHGTSPGAGQPRHPGRLGEELLTRAHVRAMPQPDPAGVPASGVGIVNLANGLTGVRLLLVPVFATLLFTDGGHAPGWRTAAWGAFAIASLTDRFDGQVARARGLVTEFGKIADPIADKALTGTALVGLSLLHDLPWWITGLVLAREIGVTVLRLAVLRRGVLPASRGGKLKTLLLTLSIGLYVLPLSGVLASVRLGLLLVAVVVAVVSGVDYVGRAVRLGRESGASRAS